MGIFEALEKAHNAICKACAPHDTVKETKKYMPLNFYDNNEFNPSESILVWDETIDKWYKDSPLFRITELEVGKTYRCLKRYDDEEE